MGSAFQLEPLSVTDVITATTVRLLNQSGVGSVSTSTICSAAGIPVAVFAEEYRSEEDVFADIVDRLMAQHGARIGKIFRKCRSLTELLTRVKLGFLDVVEEFPTEHMALMCLRVAEMSNPTLVRRRGPDRTIHDTFLTNCQLWLSEVESIQEIRWELPIHDLAITEVNTTYGLVLDFLSRRDRPSAEATIKVSAYNLAQYGRRRFKNAQS